MSTPAEAIVALAEDLWDHGFITTAAEYNELVADVVDEVYDGDALTGHHGEDHGG